MTRNFGSLLRRFKQNAKLQFENLHNTFPFANNTIGGMYMQKNEKKDEKKPVPWEMQDPKPPVIRSGHLENRRENKSS